MQEKNEILKKFSINLKKFRKEKNLTQLEVAVHLNIPRSLYLRYESLNNVADIRLSNLVKIAEFFKKSLDDFIK